MNNCCCKRIINLLCKLTELSETIISMLSHEFPLTIAAEYPTEYADRVVYTTSTILRDLLNPNPFIQFKGIINVAKPVFLKDGTGFEHVVSITVLADLALADELTNNLVYPSVYEGNYVTLTV